MVTLCSNNHPCLIAPEDAVMSIFATRAKRYLDEGPPENWQRFETLTKK